MLVVPRASVKQNMTIVSDCRSPTAEVLFGIGANLEDPAWHLAEAVRLIADQAEVTATSSVYRSEPVGYRDQPDFFNAVCQARTELTPFNVLAIARTIENRLRRVRTFRNGPRTIDIDIIAYGDLVIDTPELTVPHPRLHLRAFVLVPLNEMAPEWRHPKPGRTAAELLASGGPFERVERLGDLPGADGTTAV